MNAPDTMDAPATDEATTNYTDASIRYGVSYWQLRRAVKAGHIRAHKLRPSGHIALDAEDVAAWAEARGHDARGAT